MTPPPRSTDSPSAVPCNRKRRLGYGCFLSSPSSSHPSPAASDCCDNVPHGDVDAEFGLFLDHLRVDGKSYVFEMVIGGAGPPLRLKYEEDEGSGLAAAPVLLLRQQASGSRSKSPSEVKKKRRKKALGRNPCEVSDSCASLSPGRGWDVGGSLVDEDYQVFLNHVKCRGGSMIFQMGNNANLVYEEEQQEGEQVQEQDSDDDVIALEGLGEEDHACPIEMERESCDACPMDMEGDSLRPSSSSRLQESQDDSYFVEILQHRPSLFRSRLISTLKEPFDPKEFKDMMALVSLKKPIVKYKHLRDESIPYTTKELGNSYLDHFPDLATRIESALDDCHKNLFLRGFFFWLKNLGHKEAFRPWIPALPESSYIAIEPIDGKMTLSLQIDASEGEEKEGKEGEELQEEKEGENDVEFLYEEEEKKGEEIQEVMSTNIELCGKESDVRPGEMEIEPFHGSLQPSNSLNLGYRESLRPWVPSLSESSYVAIDPSYDKMMLSLQIDASELEEKEEEERENDVDFLYEEEEKERKEIQEEVMSTKIELCEKVSDVRQSETEIKPFHDSLQIDASEVEEKEKKEWENDIEFFYEEEENEREEIQQEVMSTKIELCEKESDVRQSEMEIKPFHGSLQIDASEVEVKEREERESDVGFLYEEEEKEREEIQEVMSTKIELCEKESDVRQSEMEIKPFRGSLQIDASEVAEKQREERENYVDFLYEEEKKEMEEIREEVMSTKIELCKKECDVRQSETEIKPFHGSLQIGALEVEEKEGEERENVVDILYEEEDKEREEIQEVMSMKIKLYEKESDICQSEMEIKPFHGSLQSSNYLNLGYKEAFRARPSVPALPESSYVVVEPSDGKMMLSLPIVASKAEEKEGKEGEELQEEKKWENDADFLYEEEEKEREEIHEDVMSTKIKLCEKQSDVHPSEMDIEPFYGSLRPSNSLNLGYKEAFRRWVPALLESSYVAIEPIEGKTMLSLQINAIEGEEKEGREGEELQEEKEWENNDDVLYKVEQKEGLQIQEVMSAKIKLCEKESVIRPIEMEIKPFHGSLQHSNSLGFQASKDVDCSFGTLQRGVISSFQSRLTSVLEKPFDQVEYELLMSLISSQKPAMKFKHLRDESAIHNLLDYSYLDRYPDLAKQIKCADPNKSLFLLRGFFFWLQNVCHKDAYKPWAQDDCNEKLQQIDVPKD